MTHGSWVTKMFLDFSFRANSKQLLLRKHFSIFNSKKFIKIMTPGSRSRVITKILGGLSFRVNSEQLLFKKYFLIFIAKMLKNNYPWVKVIGHISNFFFFLF